MIKYFLYLSLILLTSNESFAQNIDIKEDIKIGFVCELEKKILKNSEYNYQTFLAKDLTEKKLDKFEIDAKQPEKLLINGLSTFLSKNTELDVKVVNKDIVLSGELVHEVTKEIKSDNFEKDISFYKCS